MSYSAVLHCKAEFKQQHGSCQVPHRPYTPLRGWVANQQKEYKKIREKRPSNLAAEQIQRLNDLGFIFKTKVTSTWESRIEELKVFKEATGHCVVPRHHTGLGKWVAQVCLYAAECCTIGIMAAVCYLNAFFLSLSLQ